MPQDAPPDDRDDTPAFAASPSSVAPVPAPPSVSPTSTRKCEGCASLHPGTYGSGRFCSATCAKKVGARHKWAARAAAAPGAPRRPPARHNIPDSPCESCEKPHDKSYGSGRFCSVHCARRVAATRKWQKSRSEKSKRLEAIRPAMLAPPPPPCPLPVLTGKRRRVVARHLEHLSISDSSPPFYVSHHYLPHRLDVSPGPSTVTPHSNSSPPPHTPVYEAHVSPPSNLHASASSASSVPSVAASAPTPTTATNCLPGVAMPNSAMPNSAIPTNAAPGVPVSPASTTYMPTSHPHYAMPMQEAFPPHVMYPSADGRAATMCYTYATVPPYAIHPSVSPVDTASYAATSPSPSPSPSPLPQRALVPYPTMPMIHTRMPNHQMVARTQTLDPESVRGSASSIRVKDTAAAYQHALAAANAQRPHPVLPRRDKPSESGNSESAARALLCLRTIH